VLGKNECDVSEGETGRNRKSGNISELKKKERKFKKKKESEVH
jgi:hypothetical protein